MPAYDAFISYSHAKDKPIASVLQSVMQTLGKPWYRDRALRVFRDDTSLSATPHLWPSIEKALSQSRHLVLLASPEAARSSWIAKEVEYWLEHKSADTLFVGLTGGELAWDDKRGDFKWSAKTPLPKALKGCFSSEPKWVDLRAYRDGADRRNAKLIDLGADFAAAVHGMPKEDLLSEEVRQQRRARRLATGAALSLLVLAAAAVWQWREAESERARAEAETARAEAETLRAEEQRKFAQASEERAKQQQKIAEDRAFDARLRAQSAEARVVQSTDARAALKRGAETMQENLDSGRQVLPEVQSSLFEALQVARQLKVLQSNQDVSFGKISSVAVTPDGSLFAVGTADMIFIIDRKGHDVAPPISAPDGYNTLTNQVAWDEKGEVLAVASGGIRKGAPVNAALRLYGRNGAPLRTLIDRHPAPIHSLLFVPEQQVLLAGDAAGNLIRADLSSGETRVIPSGREGAINGLGWSFEGLWIAIGPRRNTYGEAQSEDSTRTSPSDAQQPPATGASADAALPALNFVSDSASTGLFCVARGPMTYLTATCGADGSVNLWSKSSDGRLEFERSLRGHVGPVYAAVWHPNGNMLATGGSDGDIRLWSSKGSLLGPPLRVGRGYGRAVRSLSFIDGGKTLLSGDNDGRVILWDTSDLEGEELAQFDYWNRVVPLASGGDFLAAHGDEQTGWKATLVDVQDPRERVDYTLSPPDSEHALDFAIGSTNRFAWTDGNAVRVRNANENTNTLSYQIKSSHATHVAFGNAGQILAIAGGRKYERFRTSNAEDKPEPTTLTFIDSATGNLIAVADAPHDQDVMFLAGNSAKGGAAFMSVGRDGIMRFWSATGQPAGEAVKLGDGDVEIRTAAFSSDGRYGALAWADSGLDAESNYQIWDTEQIAPIKGQVRIAGKITALAFSPEAETIALGVSNDDSKSIHLRFLRGELLGDLPLAQDASIEALKFSADGQNLYGATSGGTVRKWQVGPKPLLTLAKSRYEPLERQAQVEALKDAASAALEKYDWSAMVGFLEKARALDPEDRTVRILLGNAYRWTKPSQQEKSPAEYDMAIKLNPFYPINYLQRGKLRLATGNFAGAADDFAEGNRYIGNVLRGPLPVDGTLGLNYGIHVLGFLLQAMGGLEFNELRGRAFLAQGKWREAEAEFTSVIEGTPKLRAAQAYAVDIFKDEPEYAKSYRERLENPIVDTRPEIREQRARARLEQQKYDAAIADLQSAIDLLDDPKQPYGSDDYGGKMDDAALRARTQGGLHGRIASIREITKETDAAKAERLAAIASLDKAHELAPKNSWILIERGRAKIDAGVDKDIALVDYLSAVALNPENSAVQDYLAQVLLWFEQYGRAHELMTTALSLVKRPTASLRARHAIAAWRLGKREEARDEWLKLKADYVDLPKELETSSVSFWPIERSAMRDLEAFTDSDQQKPTRPLGAAVQ